MARARIHDYPPVREVQPQGGHNQGATPQTRIICEDQSIRAVTSAAPISPPSRRDQHLPGVWRRSLAGRSWDLPILSHARGMTL